MKRNKGNSLICFPENYVVIDIETTGLDPEVNKIIELGAIRYKDYQEVDRFSTLVNIDEPLDDFITNLTGITDEMLSNAPAIDEALKQYIEFISDDVLVGHNIHFDVNFIYDSCIQHLGYIFNNDFIDTLRLSRKYISNIENHKLKTICDYFNINNYEEHRCLGDCQATNECYLKLNELSKKFNEEFISNNIDLSHKPFENKKCRIKGRLEHIDNSLAEDIINKTGGKTYSAFLNFVDCLILSKRIYAAYLNPDKESSSVIKKARELSQQGLLTVISEEDFYKAYNLNITPYDNKTKLSAKDIVSENINFDETHPVYNKCFVFTGVLSKMARKEAMQCVVDLGGTCGDGVTKKTNFLVLGNNDYCAAIKDGKSTKYKKAEKLILDGQDLQIISENTFYDLLDAE